MSTANMKSEVSPKSPIGTFPANESLRKNSKANNNVIHVKQCSSPAKLDNSNSTNGTGDLGIAKQKMYGKSSEFLTVHLKNKNKMKRKSPVPPAPPTVQEVREDVSRILEKFLKTELKKMKGKALVPTDYQIVTDEEITEAILPPDTSRSADYAYERTQGLNKNEQCPSQMFSASVDYRSNTSTHVDVPRASQSHKPSSDQVMCAKSADYISNIRMVHDHLQQRERSTSPKTSSEDKSQESLPETFPYHSNGDSIDKSSRSEGISYDASYTSRVSIRSLQEEIENLPYADDEVIENEPKPLGERSRSLPPESKFNVEMRNSIKNAKSLSPSDLEILNKYKNKPIHTGGGMPNKKPRSHGASPKNTSSSVRPSQLHLADVVHLASNEQPASLSSEELRKQKLKNEKYRRSEEELNRSRHQSGSISSCDTDNDTLAVSPDRKKKSIFKRARERLNSLLNRSRERESEQGRDSTKSKNSRSEDGNIMSETHRHKHGHMEQHRYRTGSRDGIIRSREEWESVDVNDRAGHKQKHVDKHKKVCESADMSTTSESGFMNNLSRRLSINRKKPKKKVPKSRSEEFGNKKKNKKKYDRNISVPDGRHDFHASRTTTLKGDNQTNSQHTSLHALSGTERNGHVGLGSVYDDLPTGVVTSRGRNKDFSPEERYRLDRQSFVIDYDVDETEFRRRLPTGEMKVERDQHVHKSVVSDVSNDLEVDGSDSVDSPESPTRGRHPEPTQEDKEKLYNVIADRLAEIGDSYAGTSPTGGSGRISGGESTSPVQAVTNQQLTSSYDMRDGDNLNSLERDIRDIFRNAGDQFSAQNPGLSVDATGAAKDLITQTTYNSFSGMMSRTIGEQTGWSQLASVFILTKEAVKVAGAGGAFASRVKDMSLQYIEDKFAGWIVEQGGFESVLEETDKSDSDLD